MWTVDHLHHSVIPVKQKNKLQLYTTFPGKKVDTSCNIFSKTNQFPTFTADFIASELFFDICKCFNLDIEDFTFSFIRGKNLL